MFCVLCRSTWHGFSTSCDYLKTLLANFDIIFVQEHMLRDVDLNLPKSCVSEFNVFLVPAVHAGIARRPAGGIDILVRNSLCVKVDLKSSIDNRGKCCCA